MSVFLRWGIFGILGIAALMYAYNASRKLAEARAQRVAASSASTPASTTPVTGNPIGDAPPAPSSLPESPVEPEIPERCATEIVVAQRAIEARRRGDPLDRLLRIPEIAWLDPGERRDRLTKVATDWYGHEGDWAPDRLRMTVVSDCEQHAPAK